MQLVEPLSLKFSTRFNSDGGEIIPGVAQFTQEVAFGALNFTRGSALSGTHSALRGNRRPRSPPPAAGRSPDPARSHLHPSISAHTRARAHPHPHHVESRRPCDLPESAALEMVRTQIGAEATTPIPLHTAIRPLVIPARPTNPKKPNNFFSHPQHVSRWYLANPGAILSHNSHTRITNTKLQTRNYVVRNRAGDHPFTRLGNQRKCSACGFAQRLARPSP